MAGRPYLSIIVPFHNSAATCAPLLEELATLGPELEVELIFVDDGSTDETNRLLRAFAAASRAPVRIVERENGGPGAARNSGLEVASGSFVWFVDSDDRIDLEAVMVAKRAGWPEVDLIAWNFEHSTIKRSITPGIYDAGDDPAPPLDPIVASWFSGGFLRRTALRFPEYCVYEATPIEAFVLPLLVRSYVVSDFTAYYVNTGNTSVTRGPRRPRFYDRLRTVALGMAYAAKAEVGPDARSAFEAAFIRLFLWYSTPLARFPGPSWVRAMRVMRQYRSEARRFGIRNDPFDHYPGRAASRSAARLLWALSQSWPEQDGYFERLRRQAWKRDIEWTAPELPSKWRRQRRATRSLPAGGD